MEFRILGPLEVVDGGHALTVGAPKQRALLARLLLSPNGAISADRLVEALWADHPPEHAANALQYHVSQLRKLLGAERIATRAPGYLLRVEPDELDLLRFGRLVVEAEDAAPERATQLLREALGLWRGPPLADFADEPFAAAEVGRLEELRLAAVERRIECDLALGDDAELVPELEHLVATHPLRERLRGQLMLALYRAGRQAEALAAYRDARETLVATLGLEPGAALRQLERAMLEQDPGLDLSPALPAGPSLRGRASSFVGRKRELHELRSLLGRSDVRLVTLTGPAGSGKTRLAVESIEAETPVVELAPITDAALVTATIADQLGVRVRPGRPPDEALLEHLRDRRARLVLDNFEQVLAAAPSLGKLLTGAPGLQLLVTSRTPLGLAAERVFPVPPLERTEAVTLFCERAREVRPTFELTEGNANVVAELCLRLDDLPLALELAAARSNVLSPEALLERVGARLDLLRAAPGSGLGERHRTLRAAIEWSYDLLEPELRTLFTSLGVFVGGFTLAGAEAVAGEHAGDVVGGLESLLASNLLTIAPANGSEPRLGMLETLRDYALDRLAARGDGDAVRRRHAGFCLTLAEEAEPGLLGPEQLEWLERLDAERDNIRAALTWALQAREAEVGLGIGWSLWRFWQLRGRNQEGRERLQQLLALASGSPATRAKAEMIFGQLSLVLGDLETGRRAVAESLQVHRRQGDLRMVACALLLLGRADLAESDIDAALALTREALEVAREAGESYEESSALCQIGACFAARGELHEAERMIEEAVGLARKRGDARTVGLWLQTLAGLAMVRGDHVQARRLFDESLTALRGLDDPWGISNALCKLAYLAVEAGELERARTLVSEALAIERENEHRALIESALVVSARLAAADGRLERAVELYACAVPLRANVGPQSMDPWWPDPTHHIDELRSTLGEAEFDAAWARGRAVSVREAVESALEETRLQAV